MAAEPNSAPDAPSPDASAFTTGGDLWQILCRALERPSSEFKVYGTILGRVIEAANEPSVHPEEPIRWRCIDGKGGAFSSGHRGRHPRKTLESKYDQFMKKLGARARD